MSFYEDQRIRSKNRLQNEAFELYQSMKIMGYDGNYIISYAEFAIRNTTDSFRIEVFNTMISIVRSIINGKANK